jgi:hypothetical protein
MGLSEEQLRKIRVLKVCSLGIFRGKNQTA